jgi:uncharacterized protein YjbI with pentapeptide repeats
MANEEHVALLQQGVAAWNAWRHENRNIRPNLIEAHLVAADLSGADLNGADLIEANLTGAYLVAADLSGADLFGTNFTEAKLRGADLSGAYLIRADLIRADLSGTKLSGAHLSGANLSRAKLRGADLSGADLSEPSLSGVRFIPYLNKLTLNNGADFSGVDPAEFRPSGADFLTLRGQYHLSGANLNEADLRDADLTGCRIYGVSAWGLKLENAKQENLIITPKSEPEITVDNIEVAQFIYLLLHNEKIRNVIDSITSKVVLILGRFTDERKAVLDALRKALRNVDYLPILFDFAVPATRDITETVSLLARMARFIIADLTDPSSIPKELEAIVPNLAVPVQPLLEGSSRPYAMFKDYWKYDWVLPVYRYEGVDPLLLTLADKVIAPAEGKVKALQERRRRIEAELTNPQ